MTEYTMNSGLGADRMTIYTGDRVWVSARYFGSFGKMGTVTEINRHVYHVDIDGKDRAYFRDEIRRMRPYSVCKAGLIHPGHYLSEEGRCCHIYDGGEGMPTQTWNWVTNKWEDGQGF